MLKLPILPRCHGSSLGVGAFSFAHDAVFGSLLLTSSPEGSLCFTCAQHRAWAQVPHPPDTRLPVYRGFFFSEPSFAETSTGKCCWLLKFGFGVRAFGAL